MMWRSTAHGTYICPKELLATETERRLSQFKRVNLSREILSPQQHLYEKIIIIFCINLVSNTYYSMNTAIQSSSSS